MLYHGAKGINGIIPFSIYRRLPDISFHTVVHNSWTYGSWILSARWNCLPFGKEYLSNGTLPIKSLYCMPTTVDYTDTIKPKAMGKFVMTVTLSKTHYLIPSERQYWRLRVIPFKSICRITSHALMSQWIATNSMISSNICRNNIIPIPILSPSLSPQICLGASELSQWNMHAYHIYEVIPLCSGISWTKLKSWHFHSWK